VTYIGENAFGVCHITKENFRNYSSLDADSYGYWGTEIYDYETEDGLLVKGTTLGFCRRYADKVTIPNSVTSIEWYAFHGCSGLTSVTIGSGVKTIGEGNFSSCPNLLDVYCHAKNVPSTDSEVFVSSNIGNATLHVPSASVELYKAASPWKKFGNIVALTDEETGIEELKSGNGTKASVLFDLNGRRVQKAQKGLYIQNGRKVLVK
jgi:hypothetical protein